MKLICATTNAGKLRELRQVASGAGIVLEPLDGLWDIPAPVETGSTFEANAILKAEYYSRRAGAEWLIAEDSGIEVDALGGKPGVHSARFAGENATDAMNNALLRERLGGRTSPARYVCVIALAQGGVISRTFRGTVEGIVINEERGAGGFGYDPMFFVPQLGKTFGEATAEEKDGLSHRAEAAKRLFHYLAAAS